MHTTQGATEYDFRQAHSLSADQVRELQEHCANLCRALIRFVPESTGLAGSFALERIVSMTYNEYLDSMPETPIMAICQPAAPSSPIIWQMDSSMMFSYMDAMLGGDGSVQRTQDRELTLLERALAMQIVDEFMYTWTNAWPELAEVTPRVTELRQTTGRFGNVGLQEAVLQVILNASVADKEGAMRIAIPSAFLRSLLKQSSNASLRATPEEAAHAASESQVGRCFVDLSAQLARTTVSLKKLSALQVGDVIMLDRGPKDHLEVTVAGLPKFLGISGLVNGHLAVRLSAPMVD